MTNDADVHIKALEVMDKQLDRLCNEMKRYSNSVDPGYLAIVKQVDAISNEVIRLSASLDKKSSKES